MVLSDYYDTRRYNTQSTVLILIVVDGALGHLKVSCTHSPIKSLNPYCSGWCSRTVEFYENTNTNDVLILIVVDGALGR